ncbi:MAG: hypothetical protein ABIQ73_29425 [Acidimicrobiales bacterium]
MRYADDPNHHCAVDPNSRCADDHCAVDPNHQYAAPPNADDQIHQYAAPPNADDQIHQYAAQPNAGDPNSRPVPSHLEAQRIADDHRRRVEDRGRSAFLLLRPGGDEPAGQADHSTGAARDQWTDACESA